MKSFGCSVCGQILFFDNSRCLRCASELGYAPDSGHLDVVVASDDPSSLLLEGDGTGTHYRRCANQTLAACNWLVPVDDPEHLCVSCRLTTVRPNDAETDALVEFADAETAKRRLIHQLNSLGLDIVGKDADPERGVAFEFRSSDAEDVMTGHDGGVITLDLSESDDVHRERVRHDLGEPYRTVLGHLRHEIGHYYWPRLVVDAGHTDAFRELFGDETVSYQDALDAHYGSGEGPTDATAGTGDAEWVNTHVSEYATMHPWEDWAETFAHYLHIRAGLDTANSFGFVLGEPALTASRDALADHTGVSVGPMVQAWLGTTLVMNAMSRSLGTGNHYPFVLSPTVIEKLDFVHRLVNEVAGPIEEEPSTEVLTVDDV
ncbi:MAG: putative zinc-binding metallopeptidase [Ilumatobacter sp.]|uniref:zinc-binding metallopeptidase family protein n=1 Tax=Ilumatobacter sp. TaxID=1967498 RepID=UPI0032998B16